MQKHFLKLTPPEAMAIELGLARLIEELKITGQNPQINWNPEARQTQREITEAAHSAAKKLEALTGRKVDLPPFREGDQDEFLTKQS